MGLTPWPDLYVRTVTTGESILSTGRRLSEREIDDVTRSLQRRLVWYFATLAHGVDTRFIVRIHQSPDDVTWDDPTIAYGPALALRIESHGQAVLGTGRRLTIRELQQLREYLTFEIRDTCMFLVPSVMLHVVTVAQQSPDDKAWE